MISSIDNSPLPPNHSCPPIYGVRLWIPTAKVNTTLRLAPCFLLYSARQVFLRSLQGLPFNSQRWKMRVGRNGIGQGNLASGVMQSTLPGPICNLVAHSNSILIKFCHFVLKIFKVISVKGAIFIKAFRAHLLL